MKFDTIDAAARRPSRGFTKQPHEPVQFFHAQLHPRRLALHRPGRLSPRRAPNNWRPRQRPIPGMTELRKDRHAMTMSRVH